MENSKESHKLWYDTGMLEDMLRLAVDEGALTEDFPIKEMTELFIAQMYGLMVCWCMADGTYGLEGKAVLYCRRQLPLILAPYLPQTKDCTQ